MTVSSRRFSSSLLSLASLCALGAAGCAAKYNNAAGITAQPVQILWNTTGPAQVDTTVYTVTAAQPDPPLVQPPPTSPIGTIFSNTPLSAAELNATASTPGSFVYTPAEGSFLTPGVQTLSVTFTPKDTTHYMTTTRTVQVQVDDITAVSSGPLLAPQSVQIIGGGYVDGVFFHPLQKDLRYARTDVGGAYRWDQKTYPGTMVTINGQMVPNPCQPTQPKGTSGEYLQYGNWTPLLDFVGQPNTGDMGVESLGLDPSDPKRLYLSTGLNYNNDPTQQNHFYLSDDQGNTFTQVNAPFPINGNDNGRDAGERFGVDPNLGTTIYYGSRTAGLWKSLDRGMTWNQVTSFPVTGPTKGAGVTFVTFVPGSGATGAATPVIYVGVSDYNYYNADGSNNGTPTYSPIYRSIDAGATWQAVPGQPTTVANTAKNPVPVNYNLTPIHSVVGADGVTNSTGSFYVTYFSDQGPSSNTPTMNNPGAGAIYQYTPTPGTPGGAGTWTPITPSSTVRAYNDDGGYSGLSLDPELPGVIMASTQDDYNSGQDTLYRSLDYGRDWVDLKHGLSDINDLFTAPWLSFGGGGSTMTAVNGNWPSSLAIDPFDSTHVMYGTGQTLWDTSSKLTGIEKADLAQPPTFSVGAYGAAQGGRATSPACLPLGTGVPGGASIEETVVLGLTSPPVGAPLFSAVGDLGGFTHSDLNNSPASGADYGPLFQTGTSVDFAQNVPLTLVRVGKGSSSTSVQSPYTPAAGAPAGTACDAKSNPKETNCVQITVPQYAAISTNGGIAGGGPSGWSPINTLIGAADLKSVTSSTQISAGGGTIAISSDASSIVWATTDFPPACSGDSGNTWTAATNGIMGAQVISDRITPGVYYQYDSASGSLLMGAATVGAGASGSFQCTLTFNKQSTLPANSNGQISASFAVTGELFLAVNNSSAGSANGLYKSSDFGKTLTQVAGFTQGYAVGFGAPATSPAIAAYSLPAIYAAATGASGYGFYRSIDDGATWLLVSSPQHLLGTVNVMIGDPLIFGRYYIGTGGRGVAYGDTR